MKNVILFLIFLLLCGIYQEVKDIHYCINARALDLRKEIYEVSPQHQNALKNDSKNSPNE